MEWKFSKIHNLVIISDPFYILALMRMQKWRYHVTYIEHGGKIFSLRGQRRQSVILFSQFLYLLVQL